MEPGEEIVADTQARAWTQRRQPQSQSPAALKAAKDGYRPCPPSAITKPYAHPSGHSAGTRKGQTKAFAGVHRPQRSPQPYHQSSIRADGQIAVSHAFVCQAVYLVRPAPVPFPSPLAENGYAAGGDLPREAAPQLVELGAHRSTMPSRGILGHD